MGRRRGRGRNQGSGTQPAGPAVVRAGGASTALTNIDRQAEIEKLAGRLNLQQARHLVDDLDLAVRRLELNVNPRLLAEVLLIDWPH